MVYADMRAFLWPVGTRRLLEFDYPPEGPGSHYPYMPKKLFDLLRSNMVVHGDFEVCPFTHDEPGVVRFICVQSVSNMVVGPQSLQHRDPLDGDKSKFHRVD